MPIRTLNRILQDIKREVKTYELVVRDPRTPWYSKAILGFAVAYLLSPVDLVPDFIPVIGQLDDLTLVPAAVNLALRLIPQGVVEECRQKARERYPESFD